LCARGGFEVSLKWSAGQLESVSILSKLGNTIPIRYKDKVIEFKTEKGKTYQLDKNLKEI